MVENEFIIGQNSTNFIVHKGDWENSAVFTYLHIYFLKINSVTIQIVNDIDNIWCSPQKILLHFLYCISPKILLQYFNELESYWNIAIYCNNSINCNLLQYRSIKRRSVRDIDFNLYKNSAINIVCTTCVRLNKVRANNMNHNYQLRPESCISQ